MNDLLQFLPWIVLAGVLVADKATEWRLISIIAGQFNRQPAPPAPLPAPTPVPLPPAPQPLPVPVPAPPTPAVKPVVPPSPVPLPPTPIFTGKWPADNQAALVAFYGDPAANAVEPQLVHVIPPFRMTYEGKPVPYLLFHKKCADALHAALTTVWDYYGHDQAKLDALGISKTAGTYNKRRISGSPNWSNHAFGAAIDINADENGFNMVGNIPRVMVSAFKAQGARWGGDYHGRTDPMHFEFCDSGEPRQSFEAWLAHYKVVPPVPAPGTPQHGTIVTGKMSWFGGPADTGVSPSEGLALCEPSEVDKFPGLFLAEQPPGTTGLARRLDPTQHFIAMRWDYKKTSRSWLQAHKVTVTANGKTLDAQPIDWGPAESTGRIADLSKGLMDALGLKTDDTVTVAIPST
jgi:hypothetical protein